jgi:hypothetical protein
LSEGEKQEKQKLAYMPTSATTKNTCKENSGKKSKPIQEMDVIPQVKEKEDEGVISTL